MFCLRPCFVSYTDALPAVACVPWLHSQASQRQDKWIMPACLASVLPTMPMLPVHLCPVAEPACRQQSCQDRPV